LGEVRFGDDRTGDDEHGSFSPAALTRRDLAYAVKRLYAFAFRGNRAAA
jgi:hypothetical protein